MTFDIKILVPIFSKRRPGDARETRFASPAPSARERMSQSQWRLRAPCIPDRSRMIDEMAYNAGLFKLMM